MTGNGNSHHRYSWGSLTLIPHYERIPSDCYPCTQICRAEELPCNYRRRLGTVRPAVRTEYLENLCNARVALADTAEQSCLILLLQSRFVTFSITIKGTIKYILLCTTITTHVHPDNTQFRYKMKERVARVVVLRNVR